MNETVDRPGRTHAERSRNVDRSGRKHRAWVTTDGRVLTTRLVAQRAGLTVGHTAMGSGFSEGKRFNGTRHEKHHLTAKQRDRRQCDRKAPHHSVADRDAWQWPGRTEAWRPRQVHFGARPSTGTWCQWSGNSNMFMEASYYERSALPCGNVKVRSWNRYIAAATTPLRAHGAGAVQQVSVDAGRRIWKLKLKVWNGQIPRPRSIGAWAEQPDIVDYDQDRVIYVVVPRRRRWLPYVGQTKKSAWKRHASRLSDCFQPSEKNAKLNSSNNICSNLAAEKPSRMSTS